MAKESAEIKESIIESESRDSLGIMQVMSILLRNVQIQFFITMDLRRPGAAVDQLNWQLTYDSDAVQADRSSTIINEHTNHQTMAQVAQIEAARKRRHILRSSHHLLQTKTDGIGEEEQRAHQSSMFMV